MSKEDILKLMESDTFKEWYRRHTLVDLIEWKRVKDFLTDGNVNTALAYINDVIEILERHCRELEKQCNATSVGEKQTLDVQ